MLTLTCNATILQKDKKDNYSWDSQQHPEVPTVKETTNILNYANDNKVAKCPLRSAATPTIDLIRTIEDESLVPPEDLLTQIEGFITLVSSIKLVYETDKMFSKTVRGHRQ
jgi:hypothetical protein